MLTKEQLQFLNNVCRGPWTYTNGVIDVMEGVSMSRVNLYEIPVQFGQVDGDFNCYDNRLTTLKGCPSIVNGSFYCSHNQLISLEGGPLKVKKDYSCAHNQLTNLIGSPEICNGSFYCNTNQLTSLEGGPKLIKSIFHCENNPNMFFIWGIGQVGIVMYDTNDTVTLNRWIRECTYKNVIFPYFTLEENVNWIKNTQQYSILSTAPQIIKRRFSKYIIKYLELI